MAAATEFAGHVSEQELVGLAGDLVRIRSYNPPGEEAPVAGFLREFLAARLPAAEILLQPVAPERANLVARLRGGGARPSLLLCAHLDTVPPGSAPWAFDPLSGHVAEGRIHGRGALDTKGSLAAMALAIVAISRAGVQLAGDLILLATVDEESGGLGARTYVESGGMRGVGAAVIGEPTSLDLVIAHRGALWLEITAHGKAAHGAMPQEGANAILPLAALLGRLSSAAFPYDPHPLLAPPTLNVGMIGGGTKINIVPDRCSASIDLRTVPGQSHRFLLDEVCRLAAAEAAATPGVRFEVQVTNDKPPLVTTGDAPFVQVAIAVAEQVLGRIPSLRGAPYLTDGSLLAGTTGTPAIVCGPGPQQMAHQVDESLAVDELARAFQFYAALAAAYLQ